MTVRIDKRVSKCCAKETSRYAINGALVAIAGRVDADTAPDAFAVSTDGRCLSVVPLDATTHTGPGWSAIAPREALKVGNKVGMMDRTPGEKGHPGYFHTTTHTEKKGVSVPSGSITPPGGVDGVEGTFPPFADVFPRSGDFAVITLNPELLEQVMLAVQSNDESARGVSLLVPIMPGAVKVGDDMTVRCGSNKPAIVLGGPGASSDGGVALIMPINKLDPEVIGRDLGNALWMVDRAAELSKNPDAPSKPRPGDPVKVDTPAAPEPVAKVGKPAKGKRASSPVPPAPKVEEPAPTPEPTPAPVSHSAGRETPPKGQSTHKPAGWSVETGASKRGRQWVALIPAERMEPGAYSATLERVKAMGGWSKNHGFGVWADDRAKLAELIGA